MSTADPLPSARTDTHRRECAAQHHLTEVQGRQEQTVRISHLRLLPSPADVEAAPRPKGPGRRRRELKPLQAVVFLPPGTPAAGRWTDACGEYVQRRGYRLAAVCSAWADAIQLVIDGAADVIVVGRRDHLPADRTPRVDVVTEAESAAGPHRRTQRRR